MRSLLMALAIAISLLGRAGAQSEVSPCCFTIAFGTFYGVTPQFAVSPDGTSFAMVANAPLAPVMLWLKSPAATRPLPGTEQASYPFWSPDGRFIGFFAGGKLKKIAVAGGSPVTICDAPNGRGGTWNANDIIVFTSGIGDPLRKVPASGGQPAPASTLDTSRENSHRFPQFLPDGNHVLYWAGAGSAAPTLKIGSLDSAEVVSIGQADTNAAYSQGFVFFGKGNVLMAQRIDERTFQAAGDPVRVGDTLSGDAGSNFASFSVSNDGSVFYVRSAPKPFVLTWFDRTGKVLGTVGEPGLYTNVALSPDDKRVAVSLTTGTPANRDIYVLDVATGAGTRVTNHPAVDATPIWSADGTKLMFSSQREGPYQIYTQDLVSHEVSHLFPGNAAIIATDWARDNLAIGYTQGAEAHVERLGRPPVVLSGKGNRDSVTFAPPHSLRVAYQSSESGRNEIYAGPLPPAPGEPAVQVSKDGGTQPLLRRSGRELFFLALDGSVMSSLDGAAPVKLFPAPISLVIRRSYDVTSDGQRILMPILDDRLVQPIAILPKWTATVRR